MSRTNVRITDRELEVLAIIHELGPSSSEKVHENLKTKPDFLLVLRMLHGLVEKRFLQRILINKKQFYRTSRHYSHVKDLLRNSEL